MDQNAPIDTPRVALWRASRDLLAQITYNLTNLPEWDAQTTYYASQIGTLGRIAAALTPENGKVTMGNMIYVRTMMECVSNGITACEFQEYAFGELDKLKIPRASRGNKSPAQRDLVRKHKPDSKDKTDKWRTEEAVKVWNRCNCVVHGDADTSFFFGSDAIGATDIKVFALCVATFVDGTEEYLKKIGVYPTKEECNDMITRFRAALAQVVGEKDVKMLGEANPFEKRLIIELNKYGANLNYTEYEPLPPPPHGFATSSG